MRIANAVWMVFGSLVVSASCAATRESDGPLGHAIDAAVDSARDVLAELGVEMDTSVSDVVATADAAPPTTVDDVPCTTAGTWGSSPAWFAKKAYPGRSAADLARGVAILCGPALYPEGHCQTGPVGVKDGSVMALCGLTTDAQSWTAKIVMPTP